MCRVLLLRTMRVALKGTLGGGGWVLVGFRSRGSMHIGPTTHVALPRRVA